MQGALEDALEQIVGVSVETVCAGRTDAGVHARGQVVSFGLDLDLDLARVARSITSMLGGEVVAKRVSVVEDGFSARFSATWRSYRYRVLNAECPDPFLRTTVWHVADPLDLGALNEAAAGFVGSHDFSSFCRQAIGRSSEREVLEAAWFLDGDLTVFKIKAGAFCHQMVRSLTGFCVDAGLGKVDPATVADVLAAKDRHAARPIAPPHGLVLWEVGY